MSSERSERSAHIRAITITSIAAFAGVAAAIASGLLTAGDVASAEEAAGETLPQLLVILAILVQIPVYSLVYDEWGGAKDTLFVVFMTFCFWFVTFGIVLTTGVFYAG